MATSMDAPVEKIQVATDMDPSENPQLREENLDTVSKEKLDSLVNNLDSSMIEEDLHEMAALQAKGLETFMFLNEDKDFQKQLAEGGPNPSASLDQWAINRLNAFRQFKCMDTSVPFYDLPHRDITALLCKFFEQLCRVDGCLYPTESIMGLFRAFHKIICKKRDARILNTGKDEPKLSLKESPIFKPIAVACVLAMQRSRSAGANNPRVKSGVISLADEKLILSNPCTSPHNARGLQKRAAYYLLTRFCIRGGSELYKLPAADFSFGRDTDGRYVRYDERGSKNYKVGIDRFQEEHFRPPVTEYESDVVITLESMVKRLPASVVGEKFLFYQAIDNPRSTFWYSSLRVAARNLNGWLKLMYEESGLCSTGITNKSGRTTCVTRMGVEGVPPAVGMLITGHKSAGSYARYDRSSEAQVKAAQQAIHGSAPYLPALKEERGKMKRKTAGDTDLFKMSGIALPEDSEPQQKQKDVKREAKEKQHSAVPSSSTEGGSEVTGETSLSEQSTEQFDKWADSVNWDDVDLDLKKKGILGKNIAINPINAVFGKIGSMNNSWSNCSVTISIGGAPIVPDDVLDDA